VKKYLIPIVAGVVVFGSVTAFAASLTITNSSLGAGNATVASCNSSATVTYNTVTTTNVNTHKVTTAPVTSGVGCAGMAYKVSLLGASNAVLGEVAGTLSSVSGSEGTATPDFTADNIAAVSVVGVAVVITG
jgi:hypothetical protein